MRSVDGVVYVGEYEPHHKLSQELLTEVQQFQQQQQQTSEQQRKRGVSGDTASFDIWVQLAHITNQNVNTNQDASATIQSWRKR